MDMAETRDQIRLRRLRDWYIEKQAYVIQSFERY
jgi:hypothetical protein